MGNRKVYLGILILFALSALTPATDTAWHAEAQTSQPPERRGLALDSYSGQAKAPVRFPDPFLSGGGTPALMPDALSSDDRDNSTPTEWYVWAHQTAAEVADMVDSGYRPVDIYVDAFQPIHYFTVAYVANSGAYQKEFGWYYGVDETALNDLFEANNARPIALNAYDIGGGQMRFTVVMISNTGADETGWWWYYDLTSADIFYLLDANNARPTQIYAYRTGGYTRYAMVMVDNTGSDAREWWWYYNITPETVGYYVETNNARLMDMDINPVTGNLNVIMVPCDADCPYWWWFTDVYDYELVDLVNQFGARIIDVVDYPGCDGTCYHVLLINNSNEIATRVGELLRNGTDGVKGLYLEQVGEEVLAYLMSYYPFEPASTLKVAPHLYTIQQIRDNPSIDTNTLISKYEPPAEGSCPDNFVIGSETLQTAGREMMRHSDNTRTREIVDYFDVININNMMDAIGMGDSSINHVFGCGGPDPNQTTLNDLATLFRGVADGTLLAGADRDLFYSWMAGTPQYLAEGYDWTEIYTVDIPAIINQEAPSVMSSAQKQAFWEDTFVAYKAGDYWLCTNEDCSTYLIDVSIFGYAQIPFCDAGGPRQYVYGTYIYEATYDVDAFTTFDAARTEPLREQIRAGLASCVPHVFLPVVVR